MMTKIFENIKEHFFWRATAKINLKSFSPETYKEIIRFYFKFVYSNQRVIELNQLDLLQEIILSD